MKVSAIQMQCSSFLEDNLEKALKLINSCDGDVILLPELFERQYFYQERRYEYYDFAKSIEDNDAVKMAIDITSKKDVVLLISIFEKAGNTFYNTLVCVEDGKVNDFYRKSHIPDDHFYQEKFYFTPGNTGFKVFKTKYGNLGCGICWDQWFPEVARALVLNGADLLFYPTAIGSEPILEVDSMPHWQRVMQGHAAANLTPVICANRIGEEKVIPCKENNNQSSSLLFYGSSFITDEKGEILLKASRDKEEILTYEFDLEKIRQDRASWGLFRDRRPEIYGDLTK